MEGVMVFANSASIVFLLWLVAVGLACAVWVQVNRLRAQVHTWVTQDRRRQTSHEFYARWGRIDACEHMLRALIVWVFLPAIILVVAGIVSAFSGEQPGPLMVWISRYAFLFAVLYSAYRVIRMIQCVKKYRHRERLMS